MAAHEELGRDDAQPLADVFADARHRVAAALARAGDVCGLVAVLGTAQVPGQRLALSPARRGLRGHAMAGLRGLRAQCIELSLQAGLILGQGLLEQAPLVGTHGLGLDAKLPALEASELELHLLQPDLAAPAFDLLRFAFYFSILVLQLARLILDVLEHSPGQCRYGVRRQTLQVMGLEIA